MSVPQHVVIADSDSWKFQWRFEFHVDVNVLRMRHEILNFCGDEESDENNQTEQYQYPQKPYSTKMTLFLLISNKADIIHSLCYKKAIQRHYEFDNLKDAENICLHFNTLTFTSVTKQHYLYFLRNRIVLFSLTKSLHCPNRVVLYYAHI